MKGRRVNIVFVCVLSLCGAGYAAQDQSKHTLSITIRGDGTTTPSEGVHSCNSGEKVTIAATPAQGWYFARWEGDLQGNLNPTTIAMIGERAVTAVFEHAAEGRETAGRVTKQLTITRVISGGALKSSDGRVLALHGILCPLPNEPLGAEAKQFTEQRVLGVSIRADVVTHIQEIDHVNVVLPNGEVLNELLLEQGLARWDKAVAPQAKNLQALETLAKSRETGVWQPENPMPKTNPARKTTTRNLTLKGDPEAAEQARTEWEEYIADQTIQQNKEAKAWDVQNRQEEIDEIASRYIAEKELSKPENNVCAYCGEPAIGWCSIRKLWVCEEHRIFMLNGSLHQCP